MNPDEYFTFLKDEFQAQFNHVETLNLLDQAHKASALGLLMLELVKRVEQLEEQVENLKESKDWAYEAIQDLRNHAERTSK